MAKRVWIDEGHGGSDSGATSGNLVEKHMTLIAANECSRVLQLNDVIVGRTRTIDKYVSIDERARLANAFEADLFVSIHFNAGGGDRAEAICSIYAGVSEELARSIINAIVKYTGQNLGGRPVYTKIGDDGRDYFGVIRGTKAPAVIVEPAFIDSADREIVDTADEQKAMGRAIAYGILAQLGITPKSDAPASTPTPSQPSAGKASVTADIGLNLRASGSTSAAVIDAIPYGTVIDTYETVNGWTKVSYRNRIGWVKSDYLRFTTQNPTRIGVVTADIGLNVRRYDGTKIGALPYNTRVTIYVNDSVSDRWCIEFQGGKAYVSKDFIELAR